MTLFTPSERDAIKNDLLGVFTATPEIDAVILIGSAVTGYTDELSDIDIMTVVDSNADISGVMNTIYEELKLKHNILCFAPLNERRLQVYLLENFLELNLSYRTNETLKAKSDKWKVLYDKTNTVDAIMRTTYAKFDEENRININDSYQSKLTEYSEHIWHYFFHAATAISRGRFWKVVAELEYARNCVIELKGLRYSLSMSRNSEVDKIPSSELDLLQKTLPSLLTKEALTENLKHLINAAYDELEINPNPHITVPRHVTLEYLSQTRRINWT